MGEASASARPDFIFVADLPCLDLVNTQPVIGGERVELLATPADLARWLRAALGDDTDERPTLAHWERGPSAAAVLRQARRLRARLRTAAACLATGKPVGAAVVATINRVLRSQASYPQLVRRGERYVTRRQPRQESAMCVLAPVAASAAWLLEHGDGSLVRQCAGPRCVLFFYDTTRNRSRRWCSMEACGGRAKALAYYHRTHRRTG